MYCFMLESITDWGDSGMLFWFYLMTSCNYGLLLMKLWQHLGCLLAVDLFHFYVTPAWCNILCPLLFCSKQCSISTYPSIYEEEEQSPRDEYGREISPWDYALHKGTQEFQHHSYNLFTCNCHSFVANNLNRLGFHSGGWNVVNLAALVFFKGQWVSKGAVVRSLLPFGVVFVLGLLFGGSTFLIFWAFFIFLLAGWFLLGTYCFKDLIQL